MYTELFDGEDALIPARAQEMRIHDMFRTLEATGSEAHDPHGNPNFILLMRFVYKTPRNVATVAKYFTSYQVMLLESCVRVAKHEYAYFRCDNRNK